MQGKVKIALYFERERERERDWTSYNMFSFKYPSSRAVLYLVCQTVCNKDVSILVTFFSILYVYSRFVKLFFSLYASTLMNESIFKTLQ